MGRRLLAQRRWILNVTSKLKCFPSTFFSFFSFLSFFFFFFLIQFSRKEHFGEIRSDRSKSLSRGCKQPLCPSLTLSYLSHLHGGKKKLAYLHPHPLLALIAKKHWCVKPGGRRSLDPQWKWNIQKYGRLGKARLAGYIFSPKPSWYNVEGPVGWDVQWPDFRGENSGDGLGSCGFPRAHFLLRFPTSIPLHLAKAGVGLRLRPLTLLPPQPHIPLLGGGMQG